MFTREIEEHIQRCARLARLVASQRFAIALTDRLSLLRTPLGSTVETNGFAHFVEDAGRLWHDERSLSSLTG